MTVVASAWLSLAIVLCALAWFGRGWRLLVLPIAVAVAAGAIIVPLGRPTPMEPPQGNYVVLGFDIQENVAIFVLLKGSEGDAMYYKLPYSNNKASALQRARDDSESGGGAPQMTFGSGGDSEVGVSQQPEHVKPPA